jgi:phosphohistidine phosphatase
MKQLLLLRHAKSSWDNPVLADYDRPLASRGRKAARRIGRELAVRGWLPQRALVSPAARTRETWEVASAECPCVPEVSFRKVLYGASAGQLLAEAQRTPERIGMLLMLGHNPGLEDLVRGLTGENSEPEALELLLAKFPTAALARLEFDGRWEELRLGAARLTNCLRPKDLG